MMRRMICLVLALAMLLTLAACGGAGKGEESSSGGSETAPNLETSQTEPETPPAEPEPSSQQPEEPQRQEREPIGSPAVIAYPEFLTEELMASPLYQQALTRPSVIVYQGEIVTDPQPVYDFLAAAEKGEDWDLYYYNFDSYGTPSVSFSHFISDDGKMYLRSEFEYSREEMTERTSPNYRIYEIALNDYGYLNYRNEGLKVISDRDLYDDAEERQRMLDTYVYPISPTGIQNLGIWGTTKDMGPWIFIFEDIYYHENEDTPWDRFGSDWPVDYMVETLSRYFDGVTAEDLTTARKFGPNAYDPQTNTIHYEGGRGGAYPPHRVTGWEQEGETLRIDYESYDYYTGIPGNDARRLTVRLMEDGSFRYISNLER